MGTDTVLTALEFHRYGDIDWGKTAVRHRFVSNDFSTGEVYCLSEELV